MKCTRCFDEGKPGGCPKCGLNSDVMTRKQSTEVTPKVQMSELIPSSYKGLCWHRNEDEKSIAVKNVEKAMDSIYLSCAKGRVPSFSAFICGPMRLNKELFVYSCMQELIVRDFKVAPFLSTIEMRRIIRNSQYNPRYRFLNVWTYDDIMTSDILFITITHLTEDRHSDISLLQEVLDTRSRLDKPTFFVSDYKLESLVSRYQTKEYLAIFNTNANRDKLKYPYIVQAEEEDYSEYTQ